MCCLCVCVCVEECDCVEFVEWDGWLAAVTWARLNTNAGIAVHACWHLSAPSHDHAECLKTNSTAFFPFFTFVDQSVHELLACTEPFIT